MISAIVVHYAKTSELRLCVKSLLDQVDELLIINVGSEDVSGYASERVTVVAAPANLGYGWASNLGMSRASGDYLLVSNSDVQYLPNSVEALRRASDLSSGLAGPAHSLSIARRNTIGDSLQPGISREVSRMRWLRWGQRPYHEARKEFLESAQGEYVVVPRRFTLSGASILAARESWVTIGGFDEDFFLYQEDAELSMRARIRGVPVVFAPVASVVHVSGTNRRGPNSFALGVAMTSERLAWHKVGVGPPALLVLLQFVGASSRLAVAVFRRRGSEVRAWFEVLIRGYFIRDVRPVS